MKRVQRPDKQIMEERKVVSTHFVNVAQTMSTGNVQGRDSRERSFMLRCLNTQFIRPWFAESMAFWNTVITVSGKLATSASCNNNYNQILLLCCNDSWYYKQSVVEITDTSCSSKHGVWQITPMNVCIDILNKARQTIMVVTYQETNM